MTTDFTGMRWTGSYDLLISMTNELISREAAVELYTAQLAEARVSRRIGSLRDEETIEAALTLAQIRLRNLKALMATRYVDYDADSMALLPRENP